VNQDRVKILLVDDIVENLTALEALLKQLDIEVFSTTSTTQALELLLAHDFALAMVDVQMPEMNGFELAEVMRSTERTRYIPIVFVTAGSAEASYAFKGYESGAIDFLYKPLDNHTVKSKVNVFINLHRQRQELNAQVEALQRAREEQQRLLDRLENTQAELQQAMRLRDDFMSVVSHELRTPLNTLKLELYTRRLHIENGDEAAFTLDKIEVMIATDERQLDRLVRLINDMTDVSRIRTGQLSMRIAQVDIGALIKRVVEQFHNQIEMAGTSVRIHTDAGLLAEVDEFRIEQALTNLLTNAIRHCAGKPIDIRVEEKLIADGIDGLCIAVRDYGKGIEAADQARIFQQFERGANERKGSGLGLGLYIANQIVAAHCGTLGVESRPDEGALFTLTVPKQIAEDLL
jgi:signal transduction histidine kinase